MYVLGVHTNTIVNLIERTHGSFRSLRPSEIVLEVLQRYREAAVRELGPVFPPEARDVGWSVLRPGPGALQGQAGGLQHLNLLHVAPACAFGRKCGGGDVISSTQSDTSVRITHTSCFLQAAYTNRLI